MTRQRSSSTYSGRILGFRYVNYGIIATSGPHGHWAINLLGLRARRPDRLKLSPHPSALQQESQSPDFYTRGARPLQIYRNESTQKLCQRCTEQRIGCASRIHIQSCRNGPLNCVHGKIVICAHNFNIQSPDIRIAEQQEPHAIKRLNQNSNTSMKLLEKRT